MTSSLDTELDSLDLKLDEDVIEDDIPETGVVAMTPKEVEAREIEKLEDKIVDRFVHGASIQQLSVWFPQYSVQTLRELISGKLSIRNMDADLLVGAGIFGYQDDIKALSEFIFEESQKGSPVKLAAIKMRADIREKMMKYMQSVGILPDKSNPFEDLVPGNVKVTEEQVQRRAITQEFSKASPEQRLQKIEELENGDKE